MKTFFKTFALILVGILFLTSCDDIGKIKEQRAKIAAASTGDILIGLILDISESKSPALLLEGINMAIEEINEAGGVLGRQLKIVLRYDDGSVQEGKLAAKEYADNLDMVAVIGYLYPETAMATLILYEFYGLPFISPNATSSEVTGKGFKYIIASIPSDEEFGRHLAQYAHGKGYESILILNADNIQGRGLANTFQNTAESLDIFIVDRKSYDNEDNLKVIRKILNNWKRNFEFDAIFLSGAAPRAAEIIKEIRDLDITVPVIGGIGLDSNSLVEIAGPLADGTTFTSQYYRADPNPIVQKFVNTFKEMNGVFPDINAAEGYDSVKMLAHAMQMSGTTEPMPVLEALRSIENWEGVTGPHSIDSSGRNQGGRIILKTVVDGQIKLVE